MTATPLAMLPVYHRVDRVGDAATIEGALDALLAAGVRFVDCTFPYTQYITRIDIKGGDTQQSSVWCCDQGERTGA
jgi:hypothetical protein